MSKKFLLLFCLIFSLFGSAIGQEKDSLNTNLLRELNDPKNWKFVFSFDSRASRVLDQKVKFNGFKIGFEFKDRHRFGLGFYALKNPIVLPNNIIVIQKPDTTEQEVDTVNYNTNFNYTTLYYEFVFFTRKRWEFSSAFHLGTGRTTIGYTDKYKRDSTLIDFQVPIGAVSVAGHYKVFPWIGLGAGVGYRFALVGDKRVTEALNGFHTIFKVKLFLGDLYRGFFKRKDGYRLTYKKCTVCT